MLCVKHTAHSSTGTTSAAHTTARAPLLPHLHSPHATPRHTLHHHFSPEPRTVHHVHIGRRGGQSTARGRHTAENEAHSTAFTIFHENGAEGRQRCSACRWCDRCANNRTLAEGGGGMISARSCSGDCSLPSATRASDTAVPMRSSVNERGTDDNIEAAEENDSSEEDDAAYELADVKRAIL